jgi:hypothetical protein
MVTKRYVLFALLMWARLGAGAPAKFVLDNRILGGQLSGQGLGQPVGQAEALEDKCREEPTPDSKMCSRPSTIIMAYVWNAKDSKCVEISYYGCGQTKNYFSSKMECLHSKC